VTEAVQTRHKPQVATPAELAAAREARGMSQVDISQRIKLQVRQVGALEEGRWDALPGRSFVRGALRSYGKLLDVDVAPLLESIGGFAEPSQVSVMQPLDASTSRRSSGLGFSGSGRGHQVLWVIVCLVGVIALIVYFGSDQDASRIRSWFPARGDASGTTLNAPPAASPDAESAARAGAGSSSTPAPAAGTGNAAAAASASPSSPTTGSTGSSGAEALARPGGSGTAQVPEGAAGSAAQAPATASGQGANAGPAQQGQQGAQPGGAPAVPPATAAAAASGAGSVSAVGAGAASADTRGVVRVMAVRDAWVEVRGGDGAVLHNGLVKAGSTLDLKGVAPYRLVLGNASRLQLSYDGKPRDLKPHIQANDIARLQLQ
jgi:cytoskeleton protein RodZ